MKKTSFFLIVILTLLITSCNLSGRSYSNAANKYENITLKDYLSEGGLELFYDDNIANLDVIDEVYFLDFNLEKTYIFDLTTKNIRLYDKGFITSFEKSADNLTAFIEQIAIEEDISFRKFDYLIFSSIKSVFKEENKKYISFNTKGFNSSAFFPPLEIKKEGINNIENLKEICLDFKNDFDQLDKVIIHLGKQHQIDILIQNFDAQINHVNNSDFSNRINLIYSKL